MSDETILLDRASRGALLGLARSWEDQAKAIRGIVGSWSTEVCRTQCAPVHAMLLRCAGELLDVLGEPRVVDERAEHKLMAEACGWAS